MPLKESIILFVEDNEETQEHIRQILEDDVKEFYQAYNGEEGLKIFKEKKPDIIITDIKMPISSGLELTKKIRAIDTCIPILIMSAFGDQENLFQFINLQTNGFIHKPINIDSFYTQLQQLAQNIHTKNREESQQLKTIEGLHKLAYYDTLTHVANRFLFDIELDKQIKNSMDKTHSFALFFIDLDHFKNINDTYGHEAGDIALKSVVNIISQLISQSDLLARRSGDEFLLIVNEFNHMLELKELASKILLNLSEPFLYNQKKIQLTASIGISIYPHDSKNKSELLKLADTAMYNAKNSGKARFTFAHELDSQTVKEKIKNRIVINQDLYWDMQHSFFIFKNQEIILTRNETYLLSLLFSSPYYRAEYSKIYLYLWGVNCDSKKESLKTLIKILRSKLPVNIVKNIFNIGYKLEF